MAAGGVDLLRRGRQPKLAPEMVARLIRGKLDYMVLDDESLSQFARDLSNLGADVSWTLPAYVHITMLNARFIDNYAERISVQYLMSTNFFYRPTSVTEPPKYLAFYVRARRPCANPFAEFHFNSA
jgi:hypothetical protein